MKTTYGWYGGGDGTNSSGFSSMPGGFRDYLDGNFMYAGYWGLWWSSSPDGVNAWCRKLEPNTDNVDRSYALPQLGYSVRCIQDSE